MSEVGHDGLTRKAVEEILALFEENQPTDFIALELTVSSRVLDTVKPGSMLDRAIRDAETELSNTGFWKTAPLRLRKIVEMTASELQRAGSRAEREAVISALITSEKPDFLTRQRNG